MNNIENPTDENTENFPDDEYEKVNDELRERLKDRRQVLGLLLSLGFTATTEGIGFIKDDKKMSRQEKITAYSSVAGGVVLSVGAVILFYNEIFDDTTIISDRKPESPERQLQDNRRVFVKRFLAFLGISTVAGVGGAVLGDRNHTLRQKEYKELFKQHGSIWTITAIHNHLDKGKEVYIVSQKSGIEMSIHIQKDGLTNIEKKNGGRTLEKGDVWKMSHREDLTPFVLEFEELLLEENPVKEELREE